MVYSGEKTVRLATNEGRNLKITTPSNKTFLFVPFLRPPVTKTELSRSESSAPNTVPSSGSRSHAPRHNHHVRALFNHFQHTKRHLNNSSLKNKYGKNPTHFIVLFQDYGYCLDVFRKFFRLKLAWIGSFLSIFNIPLVITQPLVTLVLNFLLFYTLSYLPSSSSSSSSSAVIL